MGNTLAALVKGGGKKKIPFLSISETQYLNILYLFCLNKKGKTGSLIEVRAMDVKQC